MPKYAAKSEFPVLTDQIIQMVNDMVGFQQSEICRNMRDAPARSWKWLKICSHRRAGFSTAALMLLQEYTSSLIVYPNDMMLGHARRMAIEEKLVPSMFNEFHDNISINNHLKTNSDMNERWFIGRRPEHRHQLIILDEASMIEHDRGQLMMDKFRHELFMFCDVLVELN